MAVLDDLRTLIRETISNSIRERLDGFMDEIGTLSWEIAYGDKQALRQLKHVAGEVRSLMEFLKRNERLAYIMSQRLLAEVEKLIGMTSFWNTPAFLGKKKHVEALRKQAHVIEKAIETANRLMGSFSDVKRAVDSTRYDVLAK